MKTRMTLCCAVLTLAFAIGAHAQGGQVQSQCSYLCSQGGGSCDTECRNGFSGPWITCGQYQGNPANDLDGDGVANTGDNCTCVSNASQANCDGDSLGNACDATDNSWTRIAIGTRACEIDEDDHFGYDTLEFYVADTYRSACTGATCIEKRLADEATCFPTADMDCCTNNWWSTLDCGGAWNADSCGTPRCSF